MLLLVCEKKIGQKINNMVLMYSLDSLCVALKVIGAEKDPDAGMFFGHNNN